MKVERIQLALSLCGKTQADIARALHKSRGTVSRWISGESEPETVELLARFAQELGVSIAYLVGEDEAAQTPDEVHWLRAYRNMTPLQRQAFTAAIAASTGKIPE